MPPFTLNASLNMIIHTLDMYISGGKLHSNKGEKLVLGPTALSKAYMAESSRSKRKAAVHGTGRGRGRWPRAEVIWSPDQRIKFKRASAQLTKLKHRDTKTKVKDEAPLEFRCLLLEKSSGLCPETVLPVVWLLLTFPALFTPCSTSLSGLQVQWLS